MTAGASLPDGWSLAALGSLGYEVRERMHSFNGVHYQLWSIPAFATGSPELVSGSSIGSSKTVVRENDVLISKINPRINRVWRVDQSSQNDMQLASPEWLAFRPFEMLGSAFPKYVTLYLSSPAFRNWIRHAVSGVTGSHTRAKAGEILRQRIPVPPLAEQHRIVEVLEDHLSRLEAAESDLSQTAAKLTTLPQRVISEFVNSSRNGSKPLSHFLRDKPRNGRSVPSAQTGFPVLRLTALRESSVDVAEHKIGDWSREAAEPFLIQRGDVLLSRGNGSLHLVGRAGLVREASIEVAYPDTMVRLRLDRELVDESFFLHLWNSPIVRRQIEALARTTAGIHKINQSILQSISFPDVPLNLQRKLVSELEGFNTGHQHTSSAVFANMARGASLRQQVLRAAFSGELVDQDLNDEPSSVLLERIAAEHTQQKPGSRRRRSEPAEAS